LFAEAAPLTSWFGKYLLLEPNENGEGDKQE
jgi:hypothetical protein